MLRHCQKLMPVPIWLSQVCPSMKAEACIIRLTTSYLLRQCRHRIFVADELRHEHNKLVPQNLQRKNYDASAVNYDRIAFITQATDPPQEPEALVNWDLIDQRFYHELFQRQLMVKQEHKQPLMNQLKNFLIKLGRYFNSAYLPISSLPGKDNMVYGLFFRTTCSVEDLTKYIDETNKFDDYKWCLAVAP